MKKIILFSMFFGFCSYAKAEGPNYRVDDVKAAQEFENVYQDLRNLRSGVAGSSTSFSTTASRITSTNTATTYCDQLAGNSNGFECFVNGVLILSFPGNGDFELYPSTVQSATFLQATMSGVGGTGQAVLQGRASTPWQLGSSTSKWTSLYLSSGIIGTTTNDNAPAGYVGEYISSASVATLNVVTNNVFVNYVSMSLTAGDWDVRGELDMESNGTGATALYGAISVNSANTTTDHVAGLNQVRSLPNTSNIGMSLAVPSYRVSISGTTTVYLKFASGFASGTPRVIQGGMSARRIR